MEFAQLFIKEIFAKHGLPKSSVSDRDPRFASAFFKEVCNQLNVSQHMSTAFHPQTDGQTERMNRLLEEMLRAYVRPSHDDWDMKLPCCEFAINNAFQESVRNTPFFLNYGCHPRSPANIAVSQVTSSDQRSFVASMEAALQEAKNCLRRAQERMSKYANVKRQDLCTMRWDSLCSLMERICT